MGVQWSIRSKFNGVNMLVGRMLSSVAFGGPGKKAVLRTRKYRKDDRSFVRKLRLGLTFNNKRGESSFEFGGCERQIT